MSRRTRIFVVSTGVALIALMIVVFHGHLFGPRWPPSPNALLNRKGFSWRTHETEAFWIHCESNAYAERDDFRSVYGKRLAELEAEWHDEIATADASGIKYDVERR
jgi:hypothetical protein